MGVSTRWDREGRGVVGYTAYQSLRLLVRDRDRVGDLIKALAGAAGDAFGLDGVTLEVADPAPLLERARTAAFADARAKAEQYAGARRAAARSGAARRPRSPTAGCRCRGSPRRPPWTSAAGCRSRPASRPSRATRHRALRAGLSRELGRRPGLVRVGPARLLAPPGPHPAAAGAQHGGLRHPHRLQRPDRGLADGGDEHRAGRRSTSSSSCGCCASAATSRRTPCSRSARTTPTSPTSSASTAPTSTRSSPTSRAGQPPVAPTYLVQHGDETAGVIVVRDEGEGVAQVELDYVTPRFRDFSPGEFVFRKLGLFRDRGFRAGAHPARDGGALLRAGRLHPARRPLPPRPGLSGERHAPGARNRGGCTRARVLRSLSYYAT